MANVFSKYMKDIIRSEYKHYYPNSTQNFNSPNKRTEFSIDYGDGFSMSKYQYFISGTLKNADGTDYAADTKVKLIDNFVPYLFSRIEIKKHNYLIDEVEYPGVTSTVKSIVSYSNSERNALSNNGSVSLCTADKSTFYVCGDLSHLGLGFFEDVKIPIYKGGFVISFIRDTDNNTIYRWKVKKQDGTITGLPAEGKVIINEFLIRVPLVEFESLSKIRMVKELADLKNIPFHFRSWQCIQKPSITGNTFTFDVTNIFRNIQNPTFVMVAFQTETGTQVQDASLFSSMNVKNIRVKINENVYPEEMENLNITDGNYALAYEMYKDFKNVYQNNNDMLYDCTQFINKKCVYVIDTSKHNDNISNSRSNIIITVDFSTNPPEGTNVYVILVSHINLNYDILNNVVKQST